MQQRPMSRRRTVSTVLAAAGLVVTGLTAAEPANAAQSSISISSTNSYPGSPARVVVRAVDGSGHAIRGAKVMVTYPGQGGQRVYTNTSGQAVANFTQRAGISAYHVYVWLPGSSSVSTQASLRSQGVRPHFPGNTAPLLHKGGAYATSIAADVRNAAEAGVRIVQTDQPTAGARTEAAAVGSVVIDAQLKSVIIRQLCSAPRVCHQATPADLAAIRQAAGQVVAKYRAYAATVAWQILDDYQLESFHSAEAMVYTMLRHYDTRPTVCAFGLHLALRGNKTDAAASLRAFKSTLVNYDSHLCNSIMIYSFPPGRSSYVPSTAYDWSLSGLLPEALAMLRSDGWNPGTQPLLASPATFGFSPRYIKGTRTVSYQPAPSGPQMAQEADAFCSLGASSIIGYSWNDNNVGPKSGDVQELYNNGGLQRALANDVAACQAKYWSS